MKTKRSLQKAAALLLALTLVLALIPCTQTAYAADGETYTEVDFWMDETVVSVGETFNLNEYLDVWPYGIDIYWYSSDPSVAAVNASTGWVTGKSAGKAQITAMAYDEPTVRSSMWVEVTGSEPEPESQSISLDTTILRLETGKSATIGVKSCTPSTAEVKWSSSNITVASVDSYGNVAAIRAGQATITADIGRAQATCQVIVSDPVVTKSVRFDKQTMNLDANGTGSITATVSPAGSSLVWNSTNPSVASISSSSSSGAVIKAGSTAGVATVYAYVEGDKNVYAQCYVTVAQPKQVGYIYFDTYYLSPTVGSTVKWTPSQVIPSGMKVSYASNNTNIARVDANGTITAVAQGSCTVSAYNTDYGALTTCTVDVGAASQTTPTMNISAMSLNVGDYKSSALYVKNVPTGGTVYWVVSNGSASIVSLYPSGTGNSYCTVSGNLSGTVTVMATVQDASRRTIAYPTCIVTVNPATATVDYKSQDGAAVTFSAETFNSASKSALNTKLSYITFTSLPAVNQGTLIQSSGAAVVTNTRYYYSGSPAITGMYFQPYPSFSGTVTVPFTGCTTAGTTFNGSLRITVTRGAAQVSYSVDNTDTLTLKASDFNTVCKNQSGYDLSWVQFNNLPASTIGTLYHRYGYSNQTAVTKGTSYYYSSGSTLLGNITFVPNRSWSGTATLPITARSTNGDSISGYLVIVVNNPTALPFTDVPSGASYYADLQYVYEHDIFGGTSTTTFSPNNTITRGDMLTVLWRMDGSPDVTVATPFTDVRFTDYYATAVAWGVKHGIAGGMSATTFEPKTAVSREQALIFLYRYAKYKGISTAASQVTSLNYYSDSSKVDSWAQDAVKWACGAGVLYDTNGKLTPRDSALRYQVAEFLSRFSQKVAK